MSAIAVKAYAKINFILDVIGKRADGYHEIESVMQALELHDDVFVSWQAGGEGFSIDLDPGIPDLPSDSGNLAYRAAQLVHERLAPERCGRLAIKVVKRISVGGGLAGGSADGAAVLTALGRLWGLGAPELLEVAGLVGTDLPFCYMAQNGEPAAIARGRGTELESIEPTDCRIFLLNPGISLSTRDIYAAYGEKALPHNVSAGGRAAAFAEAGSLLEKIPYMNNDLEAAASSLCSEIGILREDIKNLTPPPLAVLLSGSGPTVFGIYPPEGPLPENFSGISTRTLLR